MKLKKARFESIPCSLLAAPLFTPRLVKRFAGVFLRQFKTKFLS